MRKNINTDKSPSTYLVDLSVAKVYGSTLKHLSEMRDVTITSKKRPCKIVAQFGSWRSRKILYESGSMEVNINGQGGESLVTVDFKFWRPYIVSLFFWSIETHFVIWLGSYIYPDIWSIMLSYFPVLVGLVVIITGLSTRYLVNNTKRRLSSRLHLFFLRLKDRESRKKI